MSVVTKRENKHLIDCSNQVIKYYGEVMNHHPDENVFLDIDVTYDGYFLIWRSVQLNWFLYIYAT